MFDARKKNEIVFAIKHFTLEHIRRYGYIDDDEYITFMFSQMMEHFDIDLFIYADIREEMIEEYEDRFKTLIQNI